MKYLHRSDNLDDAIQVGMWFEGNDFLLTHLMYTPYCCNTQPNIGVLYFFGVFLLCLFLIPRYAHIPNLITYFIYANFLSLKYFQNQEEINHRLSLKIFNLPKRKKKKESNFLLARQSSSGHFNGRCKHFTVYQ